MTEQSTVSAQRKLTTLEQVVCAVPLLLIFVGGAIGGAAGGLAWAINQKIMGGNASAPVRYGLTVLTFVGAVGLYFTAIFILAMLFPNLFAQSTG
jgi:hypothetical protein